MGKLRIWLQNYLLNRNYVVLNYNLAGKSKYFGLIRDVRKRSSLKPNEMFQILVTVRELCKKRKGNLVEVGVWRGGSARLICEAKGDNPLYLFDTFEGLPPPTKEDSKNPELQEGVFKETSVKEVKNYLKKYPNVKIIKGLFPDSAPKEFKNKKFLFVNLDVDLYKCTLGCLKYFYPKMEKGGVIISHDYSLDPGVRQAFTEFFIDKPEPIIELPHSQCIVVKT